MSQRVTLRSRTPAITVRALLGPEGAKVIGGYGGWEIVNRPRRLAMTRWRGRQPFQMDLDLMLDGYADGRSVETDCTKLERLALPPRELAEPPVVTIDGAVPHDDLTWVVNGIDWGTVIRRAGDGDRLRQAALVHLVRFVDDDKLKPLSAAEAKRRDAAAKNGGRALASTGGDGFYTVRDGDTLGAIAARQLGDYSQWTAIAEANGIRDPAAIAVGTTLRLP